MARKNDDFYFDGFVKGIDCSCRMAEALKNMLVTFNPANLSAEIKAMHEIENEGDKIKHEITGALVKAFITPIEREDIFKLIDNIDNLTDAIEDIVIHFYTDNVKSLRPDMIKYAELLCKACDAVKRLMLEFKNFRKSKSLNGIVVEINHIEEEADALYISALRDLYTKCTNPIDIIVWREIYDNFEVCFDASEHTADVVESIMITNT